MAIEPGGRGVHPKTSRPSNNDRRGRCFHRFVGLSFPESIQDCHGPPSTQMVAERPESAKHRGSLKEGVISRHYRRLPS